MKKLILSACAALLSISAAATTLNPVSLLNPAGSTAGQAVLSTGPTGTVAWGSVSISALTGILPIANGGTGQSTQATALAALLGSSAVPVANGGTGRSTIPVGSIPTGNGTSALNLVAAGSAGNMLISNGAGAQPSFGTVPVITAGSINGTPIGATNPNTGAFTTLSASGTVSGAGFSNYLLTPPAIGSTTPNQGRFTSVFATTGYSLTNLVATTSAPAVASGFGTGAAVQNVNGTAAFLIHIGTGSTATSGTLTMPTATNGWMCDAADISGTNSASFYTKLTGQAPTSVTLTNYNTSGVAAPWAAGDFVAVKCSGF